MNALFKIASRQDPWAGFAAGAWSENVDVRGFIQANYTPYLGDASFLKGPTARTTALWAKLQELLKQEQQKGVLDASVDRPSSITAHDAGYIDQAKEIIVGLQTDAR